MSDGRPRVHRVVCAIDCGRAINPDTIRAQMESGIVFGLTAALYGQITLKDGRVEQSNFHDYPVLRHQRDAGGRGAYRAERRAPVWHWGARDAAHGSRSLQRAVRPDGAPPPPAADRGPAQGLRRTREPGALGADGTCYLSGYETFVPNNFACVILSGEAEPTLQVPEFEIPGALLNG